MIHKIQIWKLSHNWMKDNSHINNLIYIQTFRGSIIMKNNCKRHLHSLSIIMKMKINNNNKSNTMNNMYKVLIKTFLILNPKSRDNKKHWMFVHSYKMEVNRLILICLNSWVNNLEMNHKVRSSELRFRHLTLNLIIKFSINQFKPPKIKI